LLHGYTDVPLNPLGLRQAALVADRLRASVPLEAIVSSPLSRALTTARMIGDRYGLEPTIVPGLMEMNFGSLEGVSVARFAAEHPELASRMLDLDDFDLGWPEGETRRAFHERVLTTFEAILGEYASHTIAVVAHGGVIASFVAQIRDAPPNDLFSYDVMNCSVTHLNVTPDDTAVHLFNDVVHLDILNVDKLAQDNDAIASSGTGERVT
jgi:broad specificity phosphatase PhoE